MNIKEITYRFLCFRVNFSFAPLDVERVLLLTQKLIQLPLIKRVNDE